MTDLVIVNRDKTKILPSYSPEKGWQITRAEAVKLGLLESDEKPIQARRTPTVPQKRRKPKSE